MDLSSISEVVWLAIGVVVTLIVILATISLWLPFVMSLFPRIHSEVSKVLLKEEQKGGLDE